MHRTDHTGDRGAQQFGRVEAGLKCLPALAQRHPFKLRGIDGGLWHGALELVVAFRLALCNGLLGIKIGQLRLQPPAFGAGHRGLHMGQHLPFAHLLAQGGQALGRCHDAARLGGLHTASGRRIGNHLARELY